MPEKKCGGCCHLKKQLEKVEQLENATKPLQIPKFKLSELQPFGSFHVYQSLSQKASNFDSYFRQVIGKFIPLIFIESIFHPPEKC